VVKGQGWCYGGRRGAPAVTFGQRAEVRGLNGEPQRKRLAVNARDGDAGGPVVDAGGAVLGMLLPSGTGQRQLPQGVGLATNADTILQMLQSAGISAASTSDSAQIPPEQLSSRASGMTVLVSCWD